MTAPPPASALTADGVGVRFGDRTVLTDAALSVRTGARVALLGANGSGKTTLLRVLSGALRPGAGAVRVGGDAVQYGRAGLLRHRQRVQLVTQNPDDQLFAPDVARDVSFGPLNLGLDAAAVRARVDEALDLLAIADLAERPLHELSFGQRKRVAIAGAMAMRPGFLLLDEPTAGLDPQGVDELLAALERLRARGTGIVLATHDVDVALAWADAVAVLDAGGVHCGDPRALLADAALLARARLRRPVVLQVAAELGVAARVRTAADLVAGVRRLQTDRR